jgi:phosphatidylglycerophosphatase C
MRVYSLVRRMSVTNSDEPRRVAAFDLDGTLTRRDCVTPFLRRVSGPRLALAMARHPVMLARALARRDRDSLKEIAVGSLRGTSVVELEALGTPFATHIRTQWMRDDTLARLEWHQAQGDLTVIVSASFESYVRPLGTLLGVDEVLCTRLEIGPDGRCTGLLEGANCRGAEKERRLRAWLVEHSLTDAVVWAYGDSAGDNELLGMADHAEWVRGTTIDRVP